MADKKKNPRKVTPRGVFKFPRLAGKPDTRFVEAGVWSVKLALDPNDPTTQPFLDYLDEQVAAALVEMQEQNPKHKKAMTSVPGYRNEIDSEGNETGMIEIGFTMPAQVTAKKGKHVGKTFTFKPVLFDAAGKPITKNIRIGGGTEGKVSFEHWAYFNAKDKEVGITHRLLGAQILKLVEWSSDNAKALGFGAEEGFDVNDVESNEYGFGSEETADTSSTSGAETAKDDGDAGDF